MIGRYSLPLDDLLYRLSPTITASNEDPAYPVTNWAFRIPSRPSKLLDDNGDWVFDFGGPANVAAFALIYHNFEEGLPAILQWNSSNAWGSPAGQQTITIPAATEDGWTVNSWIEVTGSPTYQFWRLLVGGSPGNSLPLALGRPYFSGALRDLGDVEAIEQDVRWGVLEEEEHGLIEMTTIAGVETIYPLGGKRERWAGELALYNSTAASFISLARSAQGRVLPWLLIPDVDADPAQAAMVRFEQNRWSRTRETINQNIFPFQVQELSRGLPFP